MATTAMDYEANGGYDGMSLSRIVLLSERHPPNSATALQRKPPGTISTAEAHPRGAMIMTISAVARPLPGTTTGLSTLYTSSYPLLQDQSHRANAPEAPRGMIVE